MSLARGEKSKLLSSSVETESSDNVKTWSRLDSSIFWSDAISEFKFDEYKAIRFESAVPLANAFTSFKNVPVA